MVNDPTWTAIDRYFQDQLALDDATLQAALASSAAAGLPSIAVAPNQGRLLQLLARLQGARRILEIGALAGYSTIWLARALPKDGRLVTIESNEKHADVARANIERAGLADIVELRVGRALDVLPQLAREAQGPFDLSFIDADKANIPEYFLWALKLSRRGGLIIVDNVVRDGAVLQADNPDPDIKGIRRFFAMLAQESRVTATAIQTVGSKGYDGLAVALIVDEPSRFASLAARSR